MPQELDDYSRGVGRLTAAACHHLTISASRRASRSVAATRRCSRHSFGGAASSIGVADASEEVAAAAAAAAVAAVSAAAAAVEAEVAAATAAASRSSGDGSGGRDAAEGKAPSDEAAAVELGLAGGAATAEAQLEELRRQLEVSGGQAGGPGFMSAERRAQTAAWNEVGELGVCLAVLSLCPRSVIPRPWRRLTWLLPRRRRRPRRRGWRWRRRLRSCGARCRRPRTGRRRRRRGESSFGSMRCVCSLYRGRCSTNIVPCHSCNAGLGLVPLRADAVRGERDALAARLEAAEAERAEAVAQREALSDRFTAASGKLAELRAQLKVCRLARDFNRQGGKEY